MRRSPAAFLVLLGLPLLAASAALHAQETSGSFTEGSIQVGYDSRACGAALEGAIRYDSAADKVEVCDSVSWNDWGG